MTELQDLPVVHVIAESVLGHYGEPKPLHFAGSNLWADWHGRWNHVKVEAGELQGDNPRSRKESLREFLGHGIHGEPDDIILHGGTDEIPNPETVRALLDHKAHLPVALEMRWCAYRPGRVHPLPWRGTVAQEWRLVDSFSEMRGQKNNLPAIVNAGTRLSMLGEEEQDAYPDGHALWDEEVNHTWPKWVRGRA